VSTREAGTGTMRRRGRWSSAWRVAVLVALALLAGCADSASGGGASATPPGDATPASAASATVTGDGPTPTPTILQVSGPGGQGGAAEFCTSGATVSQSLPPSIPAYPRAVERYYQGGDTNIWGYCSADGVGAVGDFYKQQLAAHGWQRLTDSSFDSIRQLVGYQGSSAAVVITIQPDARLPGTTQCVISTSGL